MKEKELLLKYLCMALPYGVKVRNVKNEFDIYDFNHNVKEIKTLIEEYNIKPYLRPMSSMTEEEHKEYEQWLPDGFNINTVNWLLEHHFDFMGLIEKGLALEAPKEMYN